MKWIFKLFKVTLFIFNSFYFLFGIGFLMTTAFLYVNSNQINDFLKVEYASEYIYLIYFLIIFAGVLLVVGFMGCTGILNENSWLLFTYFCVLFIIFSLQFTGAIYLYLKSLNCFNSFKNKIIYAIKHQYGYSTIHSNAIDYLHYKLKCCGWNSPKDWYDSAYIDPKSLLRAEEHVNVITAPQSSFPFKIPHSCCVNNYDFTCVIMHKFHEIGCESLVKVYYKQIEIYVAWLLAFFNLFQLILLVLSLYLLCMIIFNKKQQQLSERARDKGNNNESFCSDETNNQNNDGNFYMSSCYL